MLTRSRVSTVQGPWLLLLRSAGVTVVALVVTHVCDYLYEAGQARHRGPGSFESDLLSAVWMFASVSSVVAGLVVAGTLFLVRRGPTEPGSQADAPFRPAEDGVEPERLAF